MSVTQSVLLTTALLAAGLQTCAGQTANAPPVAVEESQSVLSLKTLEQMAVQHNPTLVQAGAQIQISRGEAFQAGLCPNPTLGYVSDQIGVQGTAGDKQGMFIEQEIVTGHKLQLSREKFLQEVHEAELQSIAQRYRVLYSVRVAYYNLLARDARRALREQLQKNSADAATTLKELLNVGQANRPDVLQAQVEATRAETNLKMAERQYDGAWEELAAVVGMPELQRARLGDDLEFDPKQQPVDREATLQDLLNASPEIQVAEAEVARDRIAVRRECAEPIPNVNVRAEAGYNFESQDTIAAVEVGIPIPFFDRNQGSVLQAQGEVTRAQAEVNRIELSLRRRLAETYAEYEPAMISAQTYREKLLPQAKESYELYLKSFHQARAAWPQVLNSQRQYYQLYEEYLDNVVMARQGEARIATYFVGDGLDQPLPPTPEGHRDATPKPR